MTDSAQLYGERVIATGAPQLARIHERQAKIDAARPKLLAALGSAQSESRHEDAAEILDSLGMLHTRAGDLVRASHYFELSVTQKRALGDPRGRAMTRGLRGRLLLQEGAPAEALAEFDYNLAASRKHGDPFGEVLALSGRGLALLDLKRLDEAESSFEEAGLLAEERGLIELATSVLQSMALVAEQRGDREHANEVVGAAAARSPAEDQPEAIAFAHMVQGRLLVANGETQRGRSLLARSVKELRKSGRYDLLAEALLALAENSIDEHPSASRRWLSQAEGLAREYLLKGVLRRVREIILRSPNHPAPRVISLPAPLDHGPQEQNFLLLDPLYSDPQRETWTALDESSAQVVLVKAARVTGTEAAAAERVRRMLKELRIVRSMDNVGVARVFSAGFTRGQLRVVMEQLPGSDLATRLDRGTVSHDEAWEWIRDIAVALDDLHTAGVLHRDLEPGNVVFGPRGNAVLVDFVVALCDAHDANGGHKAIGTPGYMSPEQARGEPIDARSDLFSLGVVAVEILTGENYILEASEGHSSASYAAVMADPTAMQPLYEEISSVLDGTDTEIAAILSLLAYAPASRPATGAAFLAAAGRG